MGVLKGVARLKAIKRSKGCESAQVVPGAAYPHDRGRRRDLAPESESSSPGVGRARGGKDVVEIRRVVGATFPTYEGIQDSLLASLARFAPYRQAHDQHRPSPFSRQKSPEWLHQQQLIFRADSLKPAPVTACLDGGHSVTKSQHG